MRKFISLLKASMSGEMNLFKFKGKPNTKVKNTLVTLIFSILVMFSVGSYAYLIADQLHNMNSTYLVLILFATMTSILVFFESIYKSQGLLFDCKDNDLLFSLPINKRKIFAIRIIKSLIFECLYSILFFIPAIVVYVVFENPGAKFYLIAIVETLLLPIIPTIVGSVFGYLIKGISSKLKFKKIMQTVFTLIFIMIIMSLSFNTQNLMESFAQKANVVSNMTSKIYYPISLFTNLLQGFNLMELLQLILINVACVLLFVYLFSIKYLKIISNLSQNTATGKKVDLKKGKNNFKVRKPIVSLILKEFKQFFSSTIYIINTMFGEVLLLVATIAMIVNSDGLISMITSGQMQDAGSIMSYMPKIYLIAVCFIASMTQITASSISMEGDGISITKTLPVTTKDIFLSKILMSNLLAIPTILISDIIFIVAFKIQLIDVFYIIGTSIIVPILTSIFGLIVNLMFPKLEWKSDVEVIKQSTSIMIATFSGMIFCAVLSIATFSLSAQININTIIVIIMLLCIMLTIILWKMLMKYGVKKFSKI